MRRSRELVCRLCGTSPEQRGDRVPEATGYTCSRCLIAPEPGEKRDTEVGMGLMTPPCANPSKTLSREGGFFTTRRQGGRPALPPAERRRRATERQRRWRETAKVVG